MITFCIFSIFRNRSQALTRASNTASERTELQRAEINVYLRLPADQTVDQTQSHARVQRIYLLSYRGIFIGKQTYD